MENKYNIGAEVEVKFIGTITEMALGSGGIIRYKVVGLTNGNKVPPSGIWLTDEDLLPLLKPEDCEVK